MYILLELARLRFARNMKERKKKTKCFLNGSL